MADSNQVPSDKDPAFSQPIASTSIQNPEISETIAHEVHSSEPTTLEEWLSCMTMEEAKAVVVDVGRYSGATLGEIAMHHPGDLDWYVRNYSGRNIKLKAGATVLCNAALERAC